MIGKEKLSIWLILLISISIIGCSAREDSSASVQEPLSYENYPPAVVEMVKNMSLEEKIGQLLMLDFRTWKGKSVTVINDDIAAVINDFHIGGVILFQENFVNRNQARLLIEGMQEAAAIPLMIGIDQEGGVVARLPFAPEMPGNMALGAAKDIELAKNVGTAIGSELKSLGIHINFGPVLDINSNSKNPVIGVRSFGDNPELVTELGQAYAEGLANAGIAAVGKHFPGHGDVDVDSHLALPTSYLTYEQLKNRELIPFKSLIDNKIPGIMTAHVTFKQIDPSEAISKKDGLPITLPATLSKTMLTDILRQDLGFEGVIFSDAMNMKAISDHFGNVEAAIRSIEAGTDVILMPVRTEEVYQGILRAVVSGRLSESRIDQSMLRIMQLKSQYVFDIENDGSKGYAQKSFDSIEIKEVLLLEQEAAQKAVTLVKNNGIIPLDITTTDKITVAATNQTDLSRLENAVKEHHWRVTPILLNSFTNKFGGLTSQQKDAIAQSNQVIIVTNTATIKDQESQVQLVKTILAEDIPTIVIAARNPYGFNELEELDAFVAQYHNGANSFSAAIDVIFGRTRATGRLPVQLLGH